MMQGAAERRIIRQDGLFFINLPRNMDGLKIITIQAADKEKIRKELKKTYRISAETLFIDLSGFAQNQASGKKLEEYGARLYSGNAELREQHDAATVDYTEAYYNCGNAKALLGQYDAAIADYNEAIHLQSDYASAYNNRGIAKDSLGQHDAAIADYNEAIRLKPDYALAYNNRGYVEASSGTSRGCHCGL